jgi:hypothetical protein
VAQVGQTISVPAETTIQPWHRWGRLSACLLILLLVFLFLGRQLLFGQSLVPFDLLPGTTPWRLYAAPHAPPQNPLLDSLQQYYPRRVTFNRSLRAGYLPLWNPDVYCGVPFLATQQSVVLYPPAWLLALLPAEISFGWSALFHLTLAGIGMLLLLGGRGLRPLPALGGAVVFALGGFNVVWLSYPNVSQWTWCWLPLILYAWDRARAGFRARDPGIAWLALVAALVGMQFLGGHAQISSYLLLAVLLYCGFTLACAPRRSPTSPAYPSAGSGPSTGSRDLPPTPPTSHTPHTPHTPPTSPTPPTPITRCRGYPPHSQTPIPSYVPHFAFLLALLAGAALAAGHLLPAWEYVPQTDRGERVPWESLAATAFPARQLVSFVVPRCFGDGSAAFDYQYWGRLHFVEMTGYSGVVALVLAGAALGAVGAGLQGRALRQQQALAVLALASTAGWMALGERAPALSLALFLLSVPAVAMLLVRLARSTGAPGRTPNTPHPPHTSHTPHTPDSLPTPPPAPRGLLAAYFLGMTWLGLAMAMRSPGYWLLWRFMPGFGQFTAVGRAICLVGWGLAGLGAVGLDALMDRPEVRRAAARGAFRMTGALLLAILAALLSETNQPVGPSTYGFFHPQMLPRMGPPLALAAAWLLLGAGLAWGAARQALPAGRIGLLGVGLVAADLFTFGAGFNPAADPALAAARTPELEALAAVHEPYRFYSFGPPGDPHRAAFRERMSPNLPSAYGIPDINGSDSFFPRRYLELMEASGGALAHDFGHPEAPAFQALAGRYFLRPLRPGDEPPSGFRIVAGSLQENLLALPYARVHTRIRAFADRHEMMAAIQHLDPAEAWLLETDAARLPVGLLRPAPGPPPARGVAPLRARREGPSRLVLEGATPAGVAVVAESYNAGWRAWVNGRRAPVVPVDHMIMGVPVSAGDLHVELRYEPASIRVGLFIGLLALSALAGALVFALRARTAPGGSA